jgi:hypothetical protein
MQRIWHPTHIRFGANTLKTFKQRSTATRCWARTTSTSSTWVWSGKAMRVMPYHLRHRQQPQMIACAAAVKTLFDEVQAHWRTQGVTGIALRLCRRARSADGLDAEPQIKGHRVSDFPCHLPGR